MKRMTRVALITSGGDCQGLNAAIRAVGKALYEKIDQLEIYGMYDGYRGLIEGDYKYMQPNDFSGIITQGGTILGTSRQSYVPGKDIVDDEGNSLIPAMLRTYNRLNLDCLVIMGGNGTQKSAKLIADAGMNVVTLPKTIDNDIWGTDETFGFQSAVDIATNVIDYIHSTASSHSRIFVVELMGRDAGWLTLHAGVASGADVILLPEIPYDIEKAKQLVKESGYNGEEITIEMRQGYYMNGDQSGEAICDMWKEIGVNAKVVYKDKLTWNQYPHIRSWSSASRFDNPLGCLWLLFGPGSNPANNNWNPTEKFLQAGETLLNSKDVAEQQAAAKAMLEEFDEFVPGTYLYMAEDLYGIRDGLNWNMHYCEAQIMPFRAADFSFAE